MPDVAGKLRSGSPPQDEVSASGFRSLLQAFEGLRVPLASKEANATALRHREQIKQLIDSHITDARWRDLLQRAREAAERGAHEYMLLRFPSTSCTDRARAIIEQEPGWPDTLTGDAAAVYRHWHQELRSRGFKLTARILEFTQGMPGDAGLFLTWQT